MLVTWKKRRGKRGRTRLVGPRETPSKINAALPPKPKPKLVERKAKVYKPVHKPPVGDKYAAQRERHRAFRKRLREEWLHGTGFFARRDGDPDPPRQSP